MRRLTAARLERIEQQARDQAPQDDADADLKRALLSDFIAFVRHFFQVTYGQEFRVAPHHYQIAEALTRVVKGECTRLIINIPPRYGKTELAVKMFVAWVIANNAKAKFIHLSYSDDLALDNSSQIRELVKHEEYQRLFPTPLKADSDSKKKWYTKKGGGVYATSSGGAITGFGAGNIQRVRSGTGLPADGFAGAIIIDDPLKPDDAYSEAMRENINKRYNNTIASRVNSPTETPIIVIMQRLHENDMTGYLMAGGSGEKWELLCLAAENEDGTPLWPEKHSAEQLAIMRRADSYTYASQMMQRPAPLGGGIIKTDWFGYYRMLPPVMDYYHIYADTAQKTAKRNDYTVFELWGKGQDGRIYLVDMIRDKWEAPELKRRVIAFWAKHKAALGPKLRKLKVEDKASGTGLIQDIAKDKTTAIPIAAIQRDTDKLTRVMDVVSFIEAGYVMIPEAADFTSDFVKECGAFTNNDTHAHDDQIDPMCDAINDMLAAGKKSTIDMLMERAAR